MASSCSAKCCSSPTSLCSECLLPRNAAGRDGRNCRADLAATRLDRCLPESRECRFGTVNDGVGAFGHGVDHVGVGEDPESVGGNGCGHQICDLCWGHAFSDTSIDPFGEGFASRWWRWHRTESCRPVPTTGHDVRAHRPRTQHRYADTGAGRLHGEPQGLAERRHGVLRCAVPSMTQESEVQAGVLVAAREPSPSACRAAGRRTSARASSKPLSRCSDGARVSHTAHQRCGLLRGVAPCRSTCSRPGSAQKG